MIDCARCGGDIQLGELYIEVGRRGDHDVEQYTDQGYLIHSSPLYIHVECTGR